MKGWFNESNPHALAARGVKLGRNRKRANIKLSKAQDTKKLYNQILLDDKMSSKEREEALSLLRNTISILDKNKLSSWQHQTSKELQETQKNINWLEEAVGHKLSKPEHVVVTKWPYGKGYVLMDHMDPDNVVDSVWLTREAAEKAKTKLFDPSGKPKFSKGVDWSPENKGMTAKQAEDYVTNEGIVLSKKPKPKYKVGDFIRIKEFNDLAQIVDIGVDGDLNVVVDGDPTGRPVSYEQNKVRKLHPPKDWIAENQMDKASQKQYQNMIKEKHNVMRHKVTNKGAVLSRKSIHDPPTNRVQVYDNGGKSIDRFTITFPDGGTVGMSSNPLHPQGFDQYIGHLGRDVKKNESWGKKTTFKSLPGQVKKAIERRLNEFDKE